MEKWSNKEKKFIESEVEKIKKKLHLTSWEIKLHFKNTPGMVGDNFRTLAETVTLHEYEKADITLFIDAFIKCKDKDSARDMVKHELVHLLTEELAVAARDRFTSDETIRRAHERLTQRISKLI